MEGLNTGDQHASSQTPASSLNLKDDNCTKTHTSGSNSSTSMAENASETVETSKLQSEYSSDIGFYVGVNGLDDHSKAELLEKPWTPPPNYQFPYNELTKKGKPTKKYAQRSHLDKFHWLVLSHKDKGLYCKYCVLFSTGLGNVNHNVTPLRKLAKEPLIKFDNLLGEKGDLNIHEKNPHHKSAVLVGKQFLLSYRQPSLEVNNLINTQRRTQVEENKQRLLPIVKTIIFCGRQNIPLRGHRDDGSLSLSEEQGPAHNDGNFRELLRFRVDAGDDHLRKHLESGKHNATYISKTIQNEIIDCCKSEVQSVILKRVKEAAVFSIIFDETTDIANICQLSLVFRYVHKNEHKSTIIREDFVTFANAYDLIRPEDLEKPKSNESRLTGIALAHIVEDLAKKFDLDLQSCVGFGTDNCSVMASETKGAVQELQKRALHAQRCPCHNHILNNGLASSSKVAACRNSSGTIKKIVSFMKSSPKRHRLVLEKMNSALQSICDTRWVERHDGYLQFQGESILGIHEVLEEMASWEDRKTSADAFSLLQSIRSPEFLISVASLSDVLGVTVSLSRLLQTPTLDLQTATNAFQDTLCVLQDKRNQVDEVFHNLFMEVKEIADKLDIELKKPRIVGRQTQRLNIIAQTPEEHYKLTIYIPLLDHVLTDLNDRLSQEVLNLFNLRVVLPKGSQSREEIDKLEKVVKFYSGLLGTPNLSVVKQEALLWTQRWKRCVEQGQIIPGTVLEALESCDSELYPTIEKLLRILATLPVSAAAAERSFSTLRRLKTWLRANMAEERLTGLALLNVHRDIAIDPEAVIVRFSKQKRRQEFVL